MKKSTVTLYRLPWTALRYDMREDWFQDREEVFSYRSEKKGEAAAEELFHLTNAPEDYLEESQVSLLKELDFKGQSMSVGDIARVEPIVRGSSLPVYYLCKPYGWEKFEGNTIQLLKHLN